MLCRAEDKFACNHFTEPSTRVDSTAIADYNKLVEESFPKVVTGLGNLEDPMFTGCQPHNIYIPELLPFP